MCLRTPLTASMSNWVPGCSSTWSRCRSAIFRRGGSAILLRGCVQLENIRNFLTSSALTLVIDLFFNIVFLGVMFVYSPFLSFIVIGAFPFYIAISVAATPLFRQRLDDKFSRGADNQAFLVETVTGVETLKAMAVEPQMQRRWEEQLAGYVAASFRVLTLGNMASQSVQLVSKLVTAGVLFWCQARHRGRPLGWRTRRFQHAGWTG